MFEKVIQAQLGTEKLWCRVDRETKDAVSNQEEGTFCFGTLEEDSKTDKDMLRGTFVQLVLQGRRLPAIVG